VLSPAYTAGGSTGEFSMPFKQIRQQLLSCQRELENRLDRVVGHVSHRHESLSADFSG